MKTEAEQLKELLERKAAGRRKKRAIVVAAADKFLAELNSEQLGYISTFGAQMFIADCVAGMDADALPSENSILQGAHKHLENALKRIKEGL